MSRLYRSNGSTKNEREEYKNRRITASLLLSLPGKREFTTLYPAALLVPKWWEITRCLTELPDELLLKPVE